MRKRAGLGWDVDWYWCRDGGSPEIDFRRLGARMEKDFEMI